MPPRSGLRQLLGRDELAIDVSGASSADDRETARQRRLEMLADVTQMALAAGELQTLLGGTAQALASTLGVEYTKILELKPDGQWMLLRAGFGWKPALIGKATVPCGPNSQAGFALLAGKAVVVANLADEKRFRPALLLRHSGIVSGISVVIPGKIRPFGVIGVHTRHVRQFTKEDVQFVQLVSNVLGAVIQGRQMEEALEGSVRRTRAIVNTAVDAIITIDERGTVESANPATEKLFGYLEAELVGRNINLLMPEPYHREHDGYLRRYVRTGDRRIIGIGREVTGMRKDGSTFPMSLAVSEMRVEQRRLFTGIVHDLTSRRQMERETLEAAAHEQQRIGQDLHDSLCQDLISTAFGLELSARRIERTTPVEAQKIRALGEAVANAASQARQLAHGLSPIQLDTGGLPAALELLAAKISDTFGVRCIFRWDHLARVENDTVGIHLYRIAQEAISNAIKHGKATRVELRLSFAKRRLCLKIHDNGKGLPAAIAQRSAHASVPEMGNGQLGMGLRTMHYRARLIGGSFEITTAARGGTIVICTLRESDPPGNRPPRLPAKPR